MSEESTKSPILISEIHLQNILSFGPDAKPIPLGPLNVLIGPNGSGKSNLIEAISLLKALPGDLNEFITEHGGIESWIWKSQTLPAIGDIQEMYPNYPRLRVKIKSQKGGMFYETLEFIQNPNGFKINEHFGDGRDHLYASNAWDKDLPEGIPVIEFQGASYRLHSVAENQSILAQAKDPVHFPELSEIGKNYSNSKIFETFQFGRESKLRKRSEKFRIHDRLKEDFSNLNSFLAKRLSNSAVKSEFVEALDSLFEDITDIEVREVGDDHELRLKEGQNWFPASRLSDGSVRFICLLAILLDPTPPPLICIEEPELGMHPDIIVKIADLLVEASTRTQLIVTTHSDIILDALGKMPESILVCEKINGKTEITRLDEESVKPFLAHRSLGDMWNSNIIGGRRW
ncbi:MAG: hypothetical protein RLZZ519_2890 [Bacteroidota bacterium]|jgi:predicted ATPase